MNKNAEQLALTGCALVGSDTCVVVVEGSQTSVKKYKKLMLSRIKWDTQQRTCLCLGNRVCLVD